MTRTDVEFDSHGVRCAAWHYAADGDARPCVVLAHGFSGTRDSGLEQFGEAFAAAGIDALVFDYRTFGASDGSPRQLVDIKAQVADYHAAIACARGLDGVDADRVAVWGGSLAGGHTFTVAEADPRLAAVVALTPFADGPAIMAQLMKVGGPVAATRLTAKGIADQLAAKRSQPPVTLPVTGAPGTLAPLNGPGHAEGFAAVAGPTWRNEVCARIFLTLGLYRPVKAAAKVRCPVLVQVADDDTVVPPAVSMKAAWASRAIVHHYPCDHFDVYGGAEWFDRVVEDQLAFLTRVLLGSRDAVAA